MSFDNLKELIVSLDKQLSIKQVADNLGFKKGSGSDNYFCPFHDDKKPSFIASSKSIIGTCASGCGSFNAYQVIQKIKGLTFIESIKYGCELANITFDVDSLDKVKQLQKDLVPINEKVINYIKDRRDWDTDLIESVGLKTYKGMIAFPNTKNGEIINYKYLNMKTKDFYFSGNDNSCCFFPNNEFKDCKILILVAGEWDYGIMQRWIRSLPDFHLYKVVSCSTGEKSSPVDLVTQLSKKNAPNLKEVKIFYDHDLAGKEGAYKIADKISILGINSQIFYFPDDKKKGYDISDWYKDGFDLDRLMQLKYEIYDPRQTKVKVTESDYDTERSILLYVLSNNKMLDDLLTYNIRVSDFKDWRFQEIYKLINFHILNEDGYKYCDVGLLKRTLNDMNLQNALCEIIGADVIYTYHEFVHNIQKVQISSYKKLFESKLNILNMLKDQSFKSIQSIQSDILEVFSDLLSETSYTDNVISMDEILDNIPADYESNEIKKFVPLFNNNLNFATNGGLRSGKVHLVSGEVSLGKSIFARQQSEWASYNKIPTMVYVTETDAREVGENTFASRSQIDNFYFKKGIVPSNENIHDIRVKIKKDSDKDYLFYKEIHDLSFRQLLDDIRLNVRKRGIGFVVIDQLTSIPTEGNTDRKTFITNCINSLVRLAQKESICILVVAQLKQSSQGKSNKKGLFENADMNDLGESADLQRLAYTVMILTAQKENQDRIRVWFPKNRGAKKDVYADIFAEKHFSRFVEDDKNAKSNL